MKLFRTFVFILSHPLTKMARFAALLRWMLWQLASRIMPSEGIAVRFVDDTRLLVKPGMTGATGNVYCGLHECNDMGFVLHFLRAGDLFLDIGANVGTYTILASGAVGAKTISFEPVPVTYESLLDNIHLNRINKYVESLNAAVGKSSGLIEMMSDKDTVNRIITRADNYKGEKTQVPIVRLDDFLEGRVPKLIKIDVEGFETNVIEGALKTMTNPKLEAVLMELNGSGNVYGFDENDLHQKMLGFGFQKFGYDVLTRSLSSNSDSTWNSGNNLYIRNIDSAKKLVLSAKRFSVIGISL